MKHEVLRRNLTSARPPRAEAEREFKHHLRLTGSSSNQMSAANIISSFFCLSHTCACVHHVCTAAWMRSCLCCSVKLHERVLFSAFAHFIVLFNSWCTSSKKHQILSGHELPTCLWCFFYSFSFLVKHFVKLSSKSKFLSKP